MAYRKTEKVLATIEGLIERGELLIWVHHDDGSSALVSATSVCINGDAIQIEVDPEWTFARAG